MNQRSCIALAAGSFLLAACANTPPPAQDVTVSLDKISCDQAFTPSRAKPIGLDPEKPVALDLEVQLSSPCKFDTAGNKQLYEVVTLPSTTTPYIISVASPKIGGSAFAPTAVTLGEAQEVRQIYDHDVFLNRGNKLMASFEANPEDRYLVISSHANVVGDVRSEIQTMINSQSHYNAGFGTTSTLYFGSERQGGFTFSHTGKVTVTTRPAPNRTLEVRAERPSTEKR